MHPIKSIQERKKIYILSHFSDSKYAKQLKCFKNIHEGETCFIIGNGPSLNSDDLEKIYKKCIPTFAFNRIYLMFDNTNWRPSYYISQDEKMLTEQHMRQLEQHLTDAIYSAKIAGLDYKDVCETLKALWDIDG